jgi:hypothetical protein
MLWLMPNGETIMPDEAPNPNRLIVFTNHPEEAVNYEAQGWTLSEILNMRCYPGLNPDILNRKQWGLRFWRPGPPKQPELSL